MNGGSLCENIIEGHVGQRVKKRSNLNEIGNFAGDSLSLQKFTHTRDDELNIWMLDVTRAISILLTVSDNTMSICVETNIMICTSVFVVVPFIMSVSCLLPQCSVISSLLPLKGRRNWSVRSSHGRTNFLAQIFFLGNITSKMEKNCRSTDS